MLLRMLAVNDRREVCFILKLYVKKFKKGIKVDKSCCHTSVAVKCKCF